MGNVLASYLVKVTLREAAREPGVEGGQVDLVPPTVDKVKELIEDEFYMQFPAFEVNATSERTDI